MENGVWSCFPPLTGSSRHGACACFRWIIIDDDNKIEKEEDGGEREGERANALVSVRMY